MGIGQMPINDIRYSTPKMTPPPISLLQPISNLSGIGFIPFPTIRVMEAESIVDCSREIIVFWVYVWPFWGSDGTPDGLEW